VLFNDLVNNLYSTVVVEEDESLRAISVAASVFVASLKSGKSRVLQSSQFRYKSRILLSNRLLRNPPNPPFSAIVNLWDPAAIARLTYCHEVALAAGMKRLDYDIIAEFVGAGATNKSVEYAYGRYVHSTAKASPEVKRKKSSAPKEPKAMSLASAGGGGEGASRPSRAAATAASKNLKALADESDEDGDGDGDDSEEEW